MRAAVCPTSKRQVTMNVNAEWSDFNANLNPKLDRLILFTQKKTQVLSMVPKLSTENAMICWL